MPGRIGPLLTTGVALSVAAVVVANPVIAPRADLRIPAVELSATGDAMDMLNNDFLSAIAPAQAESSSNPFAVLKDLISSLAADATYLTRSAIVSAFFAGATAVTNPELTAASHPYVPDVPPSAVPGGAFAWHSLVAPTAISGPASTEQLLAVAALPADLVPAAAEMVTALLDGLHGLSEGDVVKAAFAAGALLVTEGAHVVETVRGLVHQGVEAALDGVLTVVGDPQKAILRALRGVTDQPLPAMPSEATPSRVTPSTDSASPTPSIEAVGGERIRVRKPERDVPVVLAHPAAEHNDAEDLVPEELKDDADPTNGAETTNRVRIPARSGRLSDAVIEARNQAHGMVHNAADAVRDAVDHAPKAVAGRPGD